MLLETPIDLSHATADESFPAVDPGILPLGSRIMVQIRRARAQTKSGIFIPEDVRKTEASNTQVSKVIGVGSLAFKNRNTMELWPEGAWCQIGDYVRTPKYGGDRWTVRFGEEEIEFVIYNDLDVIGKITGDPTKIRAFI